MATSPFDDFIGLFQQHLNLGTFEKLNLVGADKKNSLKNIYVTPIAIKDKIQIQVLYKFQTKDETKIHEAYELNELLSNWLANEFNGANLFVKNKEHRLVYSKTNVAKVLSFKYNGFKAPSLNHNKEKDYKIKTNIPFLRDLGITNNDGVIAPASGRKFKQINKFLEIVENTIPKDTKGLTILDVGSGSGYLTFALYHYLHSKGLEPNIVGVELRKELVDKCNVLAKKYNYMNLKFIESDVMNYNVSKIDVIIALHACDVATDIAIAKGIKAKADSIIVAPCCQKQIRKSWKWNNELNLMMKNGIMEERMAEMVTDSIRSLILQREGYKTKVFEFVPLEHTQKNIMITAEKSNPNIEIQKEIDKLKLFFGIGEHYLESLV
jgi:2-polyprenyl-3-methyl-5-hydroxy-6-metoxy-1,4-benzoquinol methylase